ncbi:MAG TPA: VWA domain-containing protein [Gemmatimonadaceae bacterium]|nr:VWA domain-containing protein [Gemmatimonadaceae bacterium]
MRGAIGRTLRRRARKTARAIELLRERMRPRPEPVVELERVRRRLELLVAALYERPIAIAAAPAPSGALAARLLRAMTVHGRGATLATNDGERIILPPVLDDPARDGAALARYQLLALEQAERVVRGTAAHAPADATALDRDLYLVAEGHAVDLALAERLPRVAGVLREARRAALDRRPPPARLLPTDRAVERLACIALGAPLAAGEEPLPPFESALESARWAREKAKRLGADRYTGLTPVPLWGVLSRARDVAEPAIARTKQGELGRRMGLRITTKGGEEAKAGEKQEHTGLSATPLDDPRRQKEDERGLVTMRSSSGGGDASDGGGTADGAAAARPPEPGETKLASLWYPEWDCYAHRYRLQGAAVTQPEPREGSAEWAATSLREHAALVREVKHRFGKLRAQRLRLLHQRAGDELDLGALVTALTDARAGRSPDDRLYVEVRPARRGLAIALLIDVSGSTDAPVTEGRQIIDVEKDAVLFASEALDALGDRYTVLAFSGRGAEHVRVTTVKGFAEPNGESVRRRVAGLAPDANTRLGAAVRHATMLLGREPAGHRLLLILSDGKPNDVGHYQGEYAVEDTRQAIIEARARGVFPYCLAVDREEPEYLARIFGEAGHTILRTPAQLPAALLRAVRQLLGSG